MPARCSTSGETEREPVIIIVSLLSCQSARQRDKSDPLAVLRPRQIKAVAFDHKQTPKRYGKSRWRRALFKEPRTQRPGYFLQGHLQRLFSCPPACVTHTNVACRCFLLKSVGEVKDDVRFEADMPRVAQLKRYQSALAYRTARCVVWQTTGTLKLNNHITRWLWSRLWSCYRQKA